MTKYYTQEQVDEQARIVGDMIRRATMTQEERDKLSSLESSKFLGTFLTPESIPTENAVAGSYADVDAGVGSTAQRWIYDTDTNEFVAQSSSIASETAASVKQKYESNPNTNEFSDAHKAKLEGLQQGTIITEVDNINDFIVALDTAISPPLTPPQVL